MRINVPLLPIVAEVRWRRLPPFRVSLRGLMIGVGLVGLFFALVAFGQRTAESMNMHNTITFQTLRERRPPTPLETWHAAMASRYRATFERIDFLAFVAFMAFASLAAVAAFGRALDWSSRRLRFPTDDGPKDSRPTLSNRPNPEPEEPRP